MVAPMARAAVAAGADGLIIEVHCDPDHALERRRAVDVPGAVRSPDGGAADHRAGDRPQHLPRAGGAPRLGQHEIHGDSRSSRLPMSIARPWNAVINRPPEAQPPIFAKIGIVGLGLIGGSIALAAREIWPSSLVIGVDNKDVLETAMRLHAIDVAADDLIVLAEADLVILAAPVRQNIALLGAARRERAAAGGGHRHRQHQARRSSRRRARCRRDSRSSAAIRSAAPRASGLEHARPDLFTGGPGCSRRPATRPATRVEKLLGVRPRARRRAAGRSTSRRTTGCSRILSHLPQLTASALMQVVGDAVGDDGLALAGRGLVDTTRLASSPAEIWKDIAATNADEIGAGARRADRRCCRICARDLRSTATRLADAVQPTPAAGANAARADSARV